MKDDHGGHLTFDAPYDGQEIIYLNITKTY